MIWYNANNNISEREIILYDEWDVDKSQCTSFIEAKIGDEGKFVKFTDGSEIYTKIVKVGAKTIMTEAGTFRRADVVHCCVPKRHIMNLYDIDNDFVHPNVKPYTDKERRYAEIIISGKKREFNVTPRVKMLTLEMLKERSITRKFDEKVIIDKIIDNAQNDRSIHWRWSMTLLMHAHGMDPNEYIFSHMKQVEVKTPQRILFIDEKTTLTDGQKLPNTRSIEKMINSSAGKDK